ncbi:MAG TPA: homocysteine S-methyltransferase family protein [Acidimicrobiales bacterium]|nr:homocysteine S-methyltransferase family protein [Acidimicrobiales bacterium]
MPSYRDRLPQLADAVFLADGGIETSLIYDDALELPDFAAFHLLSSDDGRAALERYFRSYIAIAHRDRVGIVLETPTWRASPDWGARLGYPIDRLAVLNRSAVELVAEARNAEGGDVPVVISGCVGPRGDGYDPGQLMTAEEAQSYHSFQVAAFRDTEADMVGAITMTNIEEATGIARAAQDAGMPAAISFTVETDGRLPTGQSLGDAVSAVDAATGGYPAYYMINCAHPTHFATVLAAGEPWVGRIRGIRANASKASHAELDEADELDPGDPDELAEHYLRLRRTHPHLTVLGGCCGTNTHHIGAISAACSAAR